MNDLELLVELQELGLNEHTFRAIAMLPLVEVAWADRVVQPEEKRAILEIAGGHGLLTGPGRPVLEHWLTERPPQELLDRGRRLLVLIAHRDLGLGAALPVTTLDGIVDLCSTVAEAAGGLFGVFCTVSAEERSAIRKIAEFIDEEAAKLQPGQPDSHWHSLLDELRTDHG